MLANLDDGLPERTRALDVSIGNQVRAGQLLKTSVYEFRYLDASPSQPALALLMPKALRACRHPCWARCATPEPTGCAPALH